MKLEERYKKIAINNKELIAEVVQYICKIFKISVDEYMSNIKYYTKELLYEIKNNNNKATELRLERKKLRDDLDDLDRAFCKTPSMNSIGEGRNTGGKPNNEEIRQIQKIFLREKLGELLIESQLLEKSLDSKNELIKKFIKLIPQSTYSQILILTYVECMSKASIATELSYSIEYVDQARFRGIGAIVGIVKHCIIIFF